MGLMGVAHRFHLPGYVGEWRRTARVGMPHRDVCREALGPHHDAAEGDVAIDKQYGVGRMVVSLGEAAPARCREPLDMLRCAEDIVP